MSEPPAGGDALVRGLSRLLLGLFYRSIEVVGRERVPDTGTLDGMIAPLRRGRSGLHHARR